MDFAEMMFYAESEGYLPTRAGRINAVIAAIKADPRSTFSFEDFEEILNNHGLSYNELTRRELNYINAMIS